MAKAFTGFRAVRKIRLLLPLLLIAVLGGAVACGDDATPTPASTPTAVPTGTEPSGKLSVAVPNIGTEDWLVRNSGGHYLRAMWAHVTDPVYGIDRTDGFISFDPEQGLMDSLDFELTTDSYIATVVLKEGIPFHNGEGMASAEDLKFTYTEILKEGSINADANNKRDFLDNNPDNVEVVDSRTVRFHLKPLYGFEWTLRQHLGEFEGLQPKAYSERVGEDGFRKNPVSTGPFRFVEHVIGERLTLEAVRDHWRKTPEYDRVEIRIIPDSATRLALLLAGQVGISDLVPAQMAQVIRNKDTRVFSFDIGSTIFGQLGGLYLNEKPGCETNCGVSDQSLPWVGADPLADSPWKVRKALNLAIDRQAIVDSVLQGLGKPSAISFGFDIPGTGWYNPAWQPYPYDPDQARQLLVEAGYPGGKGIEITSYITELAHSPGNDDVALAVAGFWEKELGIKVSLQQVEHRQVISPKLRERTLGQEFMVNTNPGGVPPERAAIIVHGGKGFVAYFEHPVSDELTDNIKSTLEEDARNAFNRQWGDFQYDNYMTVPLVNIDIIFGLHNNLVADWPKTPGQIWMGDLEYVVKPPE